MGKIGRLVMEIQTAVNDGMDPELVARYYDVSARLVNEVLQAVDGPDPDYPCEETPTLALTDEPPF